MGGGGVGGNGAVMRTALRFIRTCILCRLMSIECANLGCFLWHG